MAPKNKKSMDAPKRSYNLRSVENALGVLEAFDHTVSELSVTELSVRLNLAKSTISRLLGTLSGKRYVSKNQNTGKYALGLKLFELGSVVVSHLTPRETARPVLEELMKKTGETVHMGILDGDEVVYIEKIDSSQPLSMYSKVGRRAPFHSTSLGKILLAYLPREQQNALLNSGKELTRFTEKTITDPEGFRAELDAVREQGYAVDDEEFTKGLRCLSAPVWDHSGKVVASVGIGGPAFRLGDWEYAQFRIDVMNAAGIISERLGCTTDKAK